MRVEEIVGLKEVVRVVVVEVLSVKEIVGVEKVGVQIRLWGSGRYEG